MNNRTGDLKMILSSKTLFIAISVMAAVLFIANVSAPWFLASIALAFFFLAKVVPFIIGMFTTKEAFSSSMVVVFAIAAAVIFIMRDFDIALFSTATAVAVLTTGIALHAFKVFHAVYAMIGNTRIKI